MCACLERLCLLYYMYSLWQIVEEDSIGVFSEVFLECSSEINHRLACAELGTLDHALFVEHKQISTAWQHIAALLCLHSRGSLLP